MRDLYFNTPARRKFLRTDHTEMAQCVEAVRRHALTRPEVGFAIWHEGKLVEQWRAQEAEDDSESDDNCNGHTSAPRAVIEKPKSASKVPRTCPKLPGKISCGETPLPTLAPAAGQAMDAALAEG